MELVSGVIGLPVRSEVFKKFLVDRSSLSEDFLQQANEHSTITEYFMPIYRTFDDAEHHADQLSICIRERKKNGQKTYNYKKRYMIGDERIQEIRIITAKEYVEYQR